MEHLNLILPCILVVIAFLLKLVVDRSVEASNTIQAIIELPVDIIFLALTFSVAYTLAKTENQADGLFYGFVGIAFAIVIVLIWKKTQNLLLKGSYWWILLLFINLGISVFAVKQSIDCLSPLNSWTKFGKQFCNNLNLGYEKHQTKIYT